jgi:fatty acid-binding protein DegV
VKAIQEADGADAHVVATFHQVRNRPGCERLLEQMRKAGLTVDVLATTDLGPVIATHTGIGLVAVGAIPIEYTYGAR